MKDELDRLISKEMPLKRLEEVHDTYVAMCFTGYAYKDVSILSKNHIHIIIVNTSKTDPLAPAQCDPLTILFQNGVN